jgi:hypothetical protein
MTRRVHQDVAGSVHRHSSARKAYDMPGGRVLWGRRVFRREWGAGTPETPVRGAVAIRAGGSAAASV